MYEDDDFTAGELEELFGLAALYPEREGAPRSLVHLVRSTASDYAVRSRSRGPGDRAALEDGLGDDFVEDLDEDDDEDDEDDGGGW